MQVLLLLVVVVSAGLVVRAQDTVTAEDTATAQDTNTVTAQNSDSVKAQHTSVTAQDTNNVTAKNNVTEQDSKPLLCSQLKPLTNITLAQFEGYWVLLAIFPFSEGVSQSAEPESSEECNWYRYENATSNTLEEYMEESLPGGEDPDVYRSSISIQPSIPGVWRFNDSKEQEEESLEDASEDGSLIDDMVLVAAEPSSFLIAVNCDSSAVPEERRLVKGVSIMSRRQGRRGTLVVDSPGLKELEDFAARTLGFVPQEPHIRQKTDC